MTTVAIHHVGGQTGTYDPAAIVGMRKWSSAGSLNILAACLEWLSRDTLAK